MTSDGLDGGVTDDESAPPPSAVPVGAQTPLLARLAGPVAVVVAVGIGLATLAVVDPNQPGHYPACPFFWMDSAVVLPRLRIDARAARPDEP